MDKLVETKQTIVDVSLFATAILIAWPGVKKEQAGVLYAHFAGETGGGVHCYNNNLGNHKHVNGDGYDYVSLAGVWEGFLVGDEDKDGDIDADDRELLRNRLMRGGLWTNDPSLDHAKAVGPNKLSLIASRANPATWFRAYSSLATGMAIFIASKKPVASSPENLTPRQPRYAPAWPYVLGGDPEGYARKIGALGYYTASPDVYARVMRGKFDLWMKDDAFDEAVLNVSPPTFTMNDFPIVHHSPYVEPEDLVA